MTTLFGQKKIGILIGGALCVCTLSLSLYASICFTHHHIENSSHSHDHDTDNHPFTCKYAQTVNSSTLITTAATFNTLFTFIYLDAYKDVLALPRVQRLFAHIRAPPASATFL